MTRFGEILSLWQKFANICQIFDSLRLIWQMMSILLHICDIIGLIFIAANGQILKNNLTIWSHWLAKTFEWIRRKNQSLASTTTTTAFDVGSIESKNKTLNELKNSLVSAFLSTFIQKDTRGLSWGGSHRRGSQERAFNFFPLLEEFFEGVSVKSKHFFASSNGQNRLYFDVKKT